MKKIMIAGQNGQLGRALTKLLSKHTEYEICGFGSRELNITDQEAVDRVTAEIKPYAVINCAAYTKVDDSESDVDRTYAVNALGPRNLAIAASRHHAKILQVSTDYVFDGKKGTPYREFDLPDPLGIYARTKLEGERFVERFADQYFIFRTSGLYGDGKNFVHTMLEKGKICKEVSVVSDQTATPTSAQELAKCMVKMLPTDNFGLFHATCEGACSWAEFTREIFRISGISAEVRDISSRDFASNVERPPYSVLDNYMLKLTGAYQFPDWKEALKTYL